MSVVGLESFTLTNPNPSSLFSKRASMALCPWSSSPASLRLESQFLRRPHTITTGAITLLSARGIGVGLGLLPLHCPRSFGNRSVYAFSASREESKSSEVEVEEEKSDLRVGAEESQEAWKQTLESFKEQALKMQSVSQEAYELYSEKAIVILKETSEQLKIQAEKASHDLSVVAKEISEEGKEYLSTASEKSPEPVKDIVETFASSTNELNEISKVRDFYLGIPYGVFLSFGGFLSFMLTGSTSAIRFGVILGGTLLALSISSLRSWKRGESSPLALKGQAGIASVLFFREIRLLLQRPSFGSYLTVLVSGVMVAFYLYRITLNGEKTKGSFENGTEN